MKILFPAILILIAVLSFFAYTNPAYVQIQELRSEVSAYNEALSNSKELQKERDALSETYRNFSPESLARLESLLPDSADNIRLIIDLQRMAQSYGMALSSIKFDSQQAAASEPNPLAAASPTEIGESFKPYGTFRLEFTTTAPYKDFLTFLKDVETSLRLTDVESIEFSADGDTPGSYTYVVRIKTYWLK